MFRLLAQEDKEVLEKLKSVLPAIVKAAFGARMSEIHAYLDNPPAPAMPVGDEVLEVDAGPSYHQCATVQDDIRVDVLPVLEPHRAVGGERVLVFTVAIQTTAWHLFATLHVRAADAGRWMCVGIPVAWCSDRAAAMAGLDAVATAKPTFAPCT